MMLLHNQALVALAKPFVDAKVLDLAALALVDAVAGRYGEKDAHVLLGLAMAVQAQNQGHVGIDLQRAKMLLQRGEAQTQTTTDDPQPQWPQPSAWSAAVHASPMVGGADDHDTPFCRQPMEHSKLIEHSELIVTRRMWRTQRRLAEHLREIAATPPRLQVPEALLTARTQQLCGGDASQVASQVGASEASEQSKLAVHAAARHRLCIVTGGPGTGKTTCIKRLLALLLDCNRLANGPPLRILMAAPTGKAAVRMTEAMRTGLTDLASNGVTAETIAVLSALPAQTVHKLLHLQPDGTTTLGRHNRLVADIVVIDEVSMVDLALMAQLVAAIPQGCRLILLGDKDQLASVDVGTVLADLVSRPPTHASNALANGVVRLQYSHRFKDAPTIGAVAQALQHDEPLLDLAHALLCGDQLAAGENVPDRVVRLDPAQRHSLARKSALATLAQPYVAGYVQEIATILRDHGMDGLADPLRQAQVLAALDAYRVLAVHRRGDLGVQGLEKALGEVVQEALLVAFNKRKSSRSPVKEATTVPRSGQAWLGQPILITQNAYDVDLRNGDVGIVLCGNRVDRGHRELVAVFAVQGADQALGQVRTLALARLPPHAGALAMTVHKSQGSQFEHVALVLDDRDSPILTRELVYTGLTRATGRLTWVGTPEQLRLGLMRQVTRASGLGQLLWVTGPEV